MLDMVYIVMGKVDCVVEWFMGEGSEMVWIYNDYYQEYEGFYFVGYCCLVYYDLCIWVYWVYYQLVYVDVYCDCVEEVVCVVFKDGKVILIEQVKE